MTGVAGDGFVQWEATRARPLLMVLLMVLLILLLMPLLIRSHPVPLMPLIYMSG
jgi:hypothetical protein